MKAKDERRKGIANCPLPIGGSGLMGTHVGLLYIGARDAFVCTVCCKWLGDKD